MYMIRIGGMIAKKIGVVIAMTTKLARTAPPQKNMSWKHQGICSSTLKQSDENRLMIRPTGVVSKKDMGKRRMLLRRLLWSRSEARRPVVTMVVYDVQTIRSMYATMRTEYIPM
jgi:hypothetical protein